MPTIWIVTDGTDAVVQAEELAKKITTPKNIIRYDRLAAVSGKKLPDYVIGARKGVAETLLNIKARATSEGKEGKTKIIQILDPQTSHAQFDKIILPSYEPYKPAENIIFTTGILNYINPEILACAQVEFKNHPKYQYLRDKKLTPPFTTILLGGKHVGGNISAADGAKLAHKINDIVNEKGGTALISTSKRTELEAIKGFREAIKVPHFIYDYKIREYENPYEVFLSISDEIIVTADSVRMMSEACSSGKNIRIFTPEKVGFQYIPLVKQLIDKNYAVDFDSNEINYQTKILNEAERVAELITK